ncbi:MAG: hypothetical protein JW791_03450 [Nanoarchaeota archaeon]|nr:hypothetical protein [Nanoarchaeota archaeon]
MKVLESRHLKGLHIVPENKTENYYLTQELLCYFEGFQLTNLRFRLKKFNIDSFIINYVPLITFGIKDLNGVPVITVYDSNKKTLEELSENLEEYANAYEKIAVHKASGEI